MLFLKSSLGPLFSFKSLLNSYLRPCCISPFPEPRVGKARAKSLEENSGSLGTADLVFPGWHKSHSCRHDYFTKGVSGGACMCLQNETRPWPRATFVLRFTVLDVILVVNIIFIHRTWGEGQEDEGQESLTAPSWLICSFPTPP